MLQINKIKIFRIVRQIVFRQNQIVRDCYDGARFRNGFQYYQPKLDKLGNQTCIFYGTNHGVNMEVLHSLQFLQHKRWEKAGKEPRNFCDPEYENRILEQTRHLPSFLQLKTDANDIKDISI
jgi:hypothetical protein